MSEKVWSKVEFPALQMWSVASGSALIVSERLINCPPQLAPPLQQALLDEMDWATEDEPTEVLRLCA